MIEKLDGNVFVEIDGFKALKAGDVYRTLDNGNYGPLMRAETGPELMEHPRRPGAQVWAVRAVPITFN